MREEMPCICRFCEEKSTWIFQGETQGIVFGYNWCNNCDISVEQAEEEPENIYYE